MLQPHDAAIETVGLTKHYGDVPALVDLDLEVHLGEVYGFLGPNGSGKTTMIRTILDEIRPTAGRASLLGLDSHRDSVEIRRHIGYVPADLALYPNLTGHDTITFLANLRGGVDWTIVHGLADRLGADLSKKVGDLSTGNRQKIGLIQAFMNEPRLLIMDEPSAGLDPLVQREFQTMLRETAAGGRAVFLSSHTLSEVQRVADRVGIIRHGRLIAVEALHGLRTKAMRRIDIEFSAPVPATRLSSVPGVRELVVDGTRAGFAFDGAMAQLLDVLAAQGDVVDITTREADLEEIFLAYYRDEADGTGDDPRAERVTMLSSILTKGIRDRWRAMAVATVALTGWFFLAAAIYRDIDVSLYTDLPEPMRELMGIPEGADATTLSYNVMLSFAGALTISGLAISLGAAAIAGEEQSGTLSVLLANPTSRTRALLGKAGALVVLVAAASAALWAAGRLVPVVLDVEIGTTHVGAMTAHLAVAAMFHGFIALAVGAWTGRRSMASGVAAGTMILSYFAAGLLPLVASIAWAARLFPWYYFDGSDPLINGIAWQHLLVLGGATLALGGAAVVGLERRDLGGRSTRATTFDRLRSHPVARMAAERLAGSARVSRLWLKTASEHQAVLGITALVMFVLMGVLMGPMYTAIDESLVDAAATFPEEVMAIAGGADLSTPEGWFEAETFSLMAPIAVMVVTVTIATRALAGEETQGTMSLLLSNPIRRSRIVDEAVIAMVLYAAVVGVATFAGVVIASSISSLGMRVAGIAAATILVTLLGLTFGLVALVASAATGSVRIAVFAAVGVALSSHLLNAFLPLSAGLAGLARWTPSYYAMASQPLTEGLRWSHAGVLAVLAAAAAGLARIAFERRDLTAR